MKILLQYAAQDATEAYDLVHAPGTIEEALAPEFHLGPVDLATVEKVVVEEAKAPTTDAPVSLGACLNIADIEVRVIRALQLPLARELTSAFALRRLLLRLC